MNPYLDTSPSRSPGGGPEVSASALRTAQRSLRFVQAVTTQEQDSHGSIIVA
jgi:hypothetical protein